MPLSEVILIIMGLLTLALIVAGLCRNLPVPYSVMLVVIGLMLGWLARAQPQYDFLLEFQLTPERVLFLFLPALIFESAFNLDARALLKELTPVITLAIPALLLSSLLIGLGLWLLLDMNLGLALLFGALISATDPVAVISLFREIGAPQRLTVLVEGESLFNDATAIVLFNTVLVLVLAGSVSIAAIGYAGLDFLRVFLGGIMIGISLGLLVSMLLNRLHAGRSAYLIMSLVIPYSSFIIAEHFLHFSGVMAVVGAALIFAAYGVARIPQESTQTLHDMW
ncbi:MAG: cation:proton antiporter, partial [Gammaproteobacteria bacterium]